MAEILEPPPIREPVLLRPQDVFTATWVRWLDRLWRQQQAGLGTPGPPGPAGPQGPPGPGTTPEEVQDAVGGILQDTATIDLTYADATPAITADVVAGAIGTTQLANNGVTYAKIQNVSATDRLLGRSTAGAGVVEEIICTPLARTLLDDTTQAAMQTTLGVPATSAVQPLDATLTALAGLATGANQLPYATGTDTFAQTPLTAAGRALLDDADAAAQRTTLGLGTAAQQAYTEGTFPITGAGFSGTAPSVTATYALMGKQLTVMIPGFVGASNATTFTLSGVPVGLRPRQAVYVTTAQQNSGAWSASVGPVVFLTDGTATVYRDWAFTAGWTASGNKGLGELCVSYLLP